jgi:16S rRNA processing protein RimM
MINIGRIIGTHGYKGYVKVEPLTDFPERFLDLEQVNLFKSGKTVAVAIENSHIQRGLVYIKFKGIDSKEMAQLYRSAYLQIRDDEAYPLPPGYYYHYQLVGLKVLDINDVYLGEIKEILETGANDVYVVIKPDGNELLIPALRQVVRGINLQTQTMRVELLPGLEDL